MKQSSLETHQFLDFKGCWGLPEPSVIRALHLDLEAGGCGHGRAARGQRQGLDALVVLEVVDGLLPQQQAPNTDSACTRRNGHWELAQSLTRLSKSL